MPGLVATSAPLALARSMISGKAVGGLVRQARHVDEIDGERVLLEILRLEQRIGAAKREDRGIAVMRGDEHRGAGRRAGIAQREPGGDALLGQSRQNGLGAGILAELDQRGDVVAEPRQRDGRIHRAAAAMGRDILGLVLAALLEQQKRGVGIAHRHALDALVGDHGDRVDHRAADGQGFHVRVAPSALSALASIACIELRLLHRQPQRWQSRAKVARLSSLLATI